MKKLIISLIILGIIGAYGYRHGFKNLFIPFSMEKVKEKDVNVLLRKIKKDEALLDKEVRAAERLGVSYEKLGEKYLKNHNWSPAIEALIKAVEYGQSGARVHYNLGVGYANRAKDLSSKEDADKAVYHYKRAIELNPKITDARYGLGIVLFYLKDSKNEAIDVMKKITRREPTYYEARFALARFYYETGEGSAALDVYEKLYSDLNTEPGSTKIVNYKKNVRSNIDRLRAELTGPRK